MRKKLLSLLVLLLTAATGAWAQGPWTSGDCTVTLSGGTLTISGTGAMADYASTSDREWNDKAIKNSITSVVVGSGVTHIGNNSLSQLSKMTSVTLPEGLLTIGEYAFYSDYNASFTSITIPASVTSIGQRAFSACTKLTSVTIADGSNLTTIGENAFFNCTNLATVTLNSNPAIGTNAFNNIKDGATVTMNLTANGPVDGAYWTTFYNENYGFTADGSTTIYKAAVNSGGTAVVLTEVGDIPAGNAAVLKSSNATITMTLTTSASADYTGNELLGANAAMDAPANAYCLTGYGGTLGFYTFTGEIPANRAYLVVAASSRGFLGFDEDDNTTGIGLPEAVVIEGDGPVFDLSGRQVMGQPQKGIYVKNGKKFVIK